MGDINQDDIDKLLAEAMGGGGGDDPAPAPAPAPAEELSGVASQDDIDALFAAVGDAPAPAAAPAAPAAPAPAEELSGVASQDDIDALFSAVANDAPAAPPAPAGKAPAGKAPAAKAPAAKAEELSGVANQDDIDALFSAINAEPAPSAPPPPAAGKKPAPAAPEPQPAPSAAPTPTKQIPELLDEELRGVANQDDIDALFSNVNMSPPAAPVAPDPAKADGKAKAVAPPAQPVAKGDAVGQEELNALFDGLPGGDSGGGEAEMPADAMDLDALLSSLSAEGVGAEEVAGDAAGAAIEEVQPDQSDNGFDFSAGPSTTASVEIDANAQTTVVNEFDMEQLLREVAGAAPPAAVPPGSSRGARPGMASPVADTQILDPLQVSAQARAEVGAVPPAAVPLAKAAPAAAVPPPSLRAAPAGPASLPQTLPALPAGASGGRREFSVLYGAGEVDGVANQIVALLNAMAEKAHGYMQAWIAADSEAKELRTRALAEERKRDAVASEKTALEAEKGVLAQQIQELRKRIGELEGAKLAHEESRRTLEASHDLTTRELENRISMLLTESQTLKDELVRVRNTATGVDMESRRVRFESDRLKNEVESERMERLRIQRALENREKEIQAMQAQTSGQASSLFIDELHRLVRRLESELDARTTGAGEALRQLDRLEVPESMVPAAANLRAALLLALGQEHEGEDALKSLGREAARTRGAMALQGQKAELVSFESALSTYSLVQAVDVAGALLREASTTPAMLMRKIYQCPALRRPEVADHLADLSRLLEGLRTVQEAKDRTRGVESGDSEVFYIHMFDFLHNLVRLKLINRLSGDIWRLFLDLRGRFSFITSDKQWADYRDGMLEDKNVK